MQQLQNIIETAFERRAEITPANADTVTREAVNQVIALLDSGALRVAEKIDGQWVTHQWLKKAVLLSFRINDNQVIEGAESRYFDKVPMKFANYDEARFQKEGFRVVPPAAVRQGAFIARNTVSTVQLSLRKLTRKLAVKLVLTNCCVPSTKSMYTGSTTLPDCFLAQNNSSYSFSPFFKYVFILFRTVM